MLFWGGIYATALSRQGRLDDTMEQARLACRRDGKLYFPRIILASLLTRAGRHEEAFSAFNEARRIYPALSIREIVVLVGRRNVEAMQAAWASL